MNLINFSIGEFVGILVIFGLLIWIFIIIFEGLGKIKDLMYK